ncbi:hypothetical protein [Pararobbsia silviterrae]|uniref:hypothetical protein n=1 Tax=Pararobbsia silviterrae TaxID=1792498 RepID=UPI001F0CD6B0|nr:hypothetical protein [Pararobbsia silviterrae]
MKPLLVAAGALCASLAFAATPVSAASPGQDNSLAVPPQVDAPPSGDAASAQPEVRPPNTAPSAEHLSPNEQAGLPDLDKINRTPTANGSASSKVEFTDQRQPSFHTKERDGTEITEYRDRGKPTEIDVHSGFGTSYQMTPPPDNTPNIPNSGNGPSTGRLPSIHISY